MKVISIHYTEVLMIFIAITFIIGFYGVLDGTKIAVEEIRRDEMSCHCPMRCMEGTGFHILHFIFR